MELVFVELVKEEESDSAAWFTRMTEEKIHFGFVGSC